MEVLSVKTSLVTKDIGVLELSDSFPVNKTITEIIEHVTYRSYNTVRDMKIERKSYAEY